MIAVDTNILVYSVAETSPNYERAKALVAQLAESGRKWCIPWPCIHEFLGIITHPKIYRPSMKPTTAVRQVEAWMGSPSLQLIGEQAGYWEHLQILLASDRIQGPKIHDARIAAICRAAGVREIWSADRDYSQFPGIVVRNPLV